MKPKQFNTRGFSLLLAITLHVVTLPVHGELPACFQASQPSVKHMVIPLYANDMGEAMAVVTVERTFTDYQRKGFLRIGLMPMLVIDGVTIEVRDPSKAAHALAAVNEWLDPGKAGKLIELRRVVVILSKTHSHRLAADSVRLAANGQWNLFSVEYQRGTVSHSGGVASLQIVGKHAGRIGWNDTQSSELFDCSKSVKK